MTVITLANKKLVYFLDYLGLIAVKDSFVRANGRGLVTFTLGFGLFLGVAVYLGAIYFSFNLSFQMKNDQTKLMGLNNELLELKLRVQKTETEMTSSRNLVLGQMVEVSKIKYIKSGAETVSFR